LPGEEWPCQKTYMRWNAAMMVQRAQKPEIGVGGHISSFAGVATLVDGHRVDVVGGGDHGDADALGARILQEGAHDVLRALGAHRAYMRWNAAMMVQRAQKPEIGVGGHISSFAGVANVVGGGDHGDADALGARILQEGAHDVLRALGALGRWNAAMMVQRAQKPEIGVGGHISSFAGVATLYEVPGPPR
jgi:pyruvate dehydrogenase complex dehydrogenase (E1) component